jgi:hypothetical protein
MPKPVTADASQSADKIRERFTASLTSRVEIVSKFLIDAAEVRVDKYFNEKLESGDNPYTTKHEVSAAVAASSRRVGTRVVNEPAKPAVHKMTAEIPLFEAATDFASGNQPEVKAAYDQLAKNGDEWTAVKARLKKHLEGAGFQVFFSAEKTDKLVLRLHDPKFESAVSTALKTD